MAPRKGKGKATALPKEPETFTVYGDILQQTEPTEEHEGAILINCGDAKEVWLPINSIQFDGERGDTGVAITIPDWLAEQEGLHDGQGKPGPQPGPEGDGETPPEAAAEAEAPAPQPCRFKAEVTGIADGAYTILVIAGDESREFSFAKDALRFDGDDVVDLQVGYTGIEFLLGWPVAVESGLADFLGLSESVADVPAQEEPQAEAAPADPVSAEEADNDAPKTKPYKGKLRTETIKDYVELTPEEKVSYAQDLSEAMERRMDHKETAATYSRLSREADKEAYKIKGILDAGREEREIDCDVIGDFNTGETVWVESQWPHREIRRRPMTDKDRQLLLPMDEPKQPEPEAAAAQPAEPAADAVAEPEEEPDTVTLYGEIMEQRENETVFRVHYGDEANTVAEFSIPNDQIQMPAFGDPGSTQDMITLTRAYALAVEIIAAPEEAEEATPVDETSGDIVPGLEGMDFDTLAEAAATEGDAFTVDAGAEQEKACASCSHLDAADEDNACEGCDDALSNFTPLEQPVQQDAATAGGVQ